MAALAFIRVPPSPNVANTNMASGKVQRLQCHTHDKWVKVFQPRVSRSPFSSATPFRPITHPCARKTFARPWAKAPAPAPARIGSCCSLLFLHPFSRGTGGLCATFSPKSDERRLHLPEKWNANTRRRAASWRAIFTTCCNSSGSSAYVHIRDRSSSNAYPTLAHEVAVCSWTLTVCLST